MIITIRILNSMVVKSKLCTCFFVSQNIKITGTNLENQIILSLKVYKDRALYTREALKSLFTVCGHWTERRPDVIEVGR